MSCKKFVKKSRNGNEKRGRNGNGNGKKTGTKKSLLVNRKFKCENWFVMIK